ncbi:MAG: hypothetical protein JWQ34_3434 [Mucilaginibacter sp.]|uniref:DUF4199 domain-containing protein n=1 Tax=Mucilaginibacter sp. TaxID=1882438 RepID=UPI002637DFED|nr:DUF4199 domain-containing protein [Mucilaginibacter sp.]MDB5005209.1 hypothetical protein [Mucilaginibacter sp.]
MKKIVLVCGAIAGLIAGGWAVFYIYLCSNKMDFDNGEIYGYTAMIVAFSLVFVGVKNYRDNNLHGQISFGKAFQVGILIVMVASTIYVVLWLIDYYCFISNFAEIYTAHVLDKLKASGASTVVIAKKAKEMAEFSRMYKNPFFNAIMTYCEIVPVGLIVALLAALILKRKTKLNDTVTA